MAHHTGPAPLLRRLATGAPDHAGIVIHGPEAVGEVRRWVIRAARATVRQADDLALIASELVTNALRHTRSGQGGQVVVELFREEQQYRLQVTDNGPHPGAATYPHLRGAAPGEEPGGLGLHLVNMLTTGWEWYLRPDGRITVQAQVRRGSAR